MSCIMIGSQRTHAGWFALLLDLEEIDVGYWSPLLRDLFLVDSRNIGQAERPVANISAQTIKLQ